MADRARGEEGSVELVLVFPAAMLLILLCVQASLWFLARTAAIDAARDGARAAALLDAPPGAGQAAAARTLHQLGGPLVGDVTVTEQRDPATATVAVAARSEQILPGLAVTIHAAAADPVEAFRP